MTKFSKSNFGLYRVKGGCPDMDKAGKVVIEVFNQEDLKITTECNSTCVDFLDIFMNLKRETTSPNIKPNMNTKYVSISSSHPPAIIKSIPVGVSRRLSNISSSIQLFIQELPNYQVAMDRAGHKKKMAYSQVNNMVEKERRREVQPNMEQ